VAHDAPPPPTAAFAPAGAPAKTTTPPDAGAAEAANRAHRDRPHGAIATAAFAPTSEIAATPGTSSQLGIERNFTNTRISGMLSTSSITLAMKGDAIRPHTITGWSWNRVGLVVMLYSVSAPIITAVVPEPGTPRVSIGTNERLAEALLAASGAATPRMSPLPNWWSLPAMRRSIA
jgi:hypothetical protein